MNDLPPLQEVVIIEIIAKIRSPRAGPGAACFEAPCGAQAVSAGPGLPHGHRHREGKKWHLCELLCVCVTGKWEDELQTGSEIDGGKLRRKVQMAQSQLSVCGEELLRLEGCIGKTKPCFRIFS